MATVTGVTAARAQAIEDASVTSGHISGTHLYLTTVGGDETDAGIVVRPSIANLAVPNSDTVLDVSLFTEISALEIVVHPLVTTAFMVTLDIDLRLEATGAGAIVETVVELSVDGVGDAKTIRHTSSEMASGKIRRVPLSASWLITGLSVGNDHSFTAQAIITNQVSTTSVRIVEPGTQMIVVGHSV